MKMDALLKQVAEGLEKNLPAILTGGSVVTELCTVGYSVWAGWKIKEITENEKLDTKTKVKKIALVSAPVAVGTAVSSGCAIAAHKENTKRYAALAVTATAGVASLAKNDEAKDKVLDVVDRDHKIHRTKKDEKSNITANSNEVIEIYDEVTGYKFKTTLSDLWFTVNRFNDEVCAYINTGETVSIDKFYDTLLGESYDAVPAHELIKFGNKISYMDRDEAPVVLSIQLDSRLDENMKPIYTMTYDYID